MNASDRTSTPVVSTYVHVPEAAKIEHAIDASSFGVSASIRIGNYGENDATLFFRSPKQLDQLIEQAKRAADKMRREIDIQARMAAARDENT